MMEREQRRSTIRVVKIGTILVLRDSACVTRTPTQLTRKKRSTFDEGETRKEGASRTFPGSRLRRSAVPGPGSCASNAHVRLPHRKVMEGMGLGANFERVSVVESLP